MRLRSSARPSWFFTQPPHQSKSKSVSHRKGRSPTRAFPLHPARSDDPSVVGKQIIPERFQVPMVMLKPPLGRRVQDTVGIGFVQVFSGRQIDNILPVLDLKGAKGSAAEKSMRPATVFPLEAGSARSFASIRSLQLIDKPLTLVRYYPQSQAGIPAIHRESCFPAASISVGQKNEGASLCREVLEPPADSGLW